MSEVAQADGGMLPVVGALATKTHKNGLIGVECACTHNCLRRVCLTVAHASHPNRVVGFQVSSRRDAGKHLLPKAFTATGKKYRRKCW
ncbi:hypothetical protein FQA39_LY08699 [Lamprigera yunnana]|nr:hypothetical protein FQA39_LY08699 [Lamprigera yunnana]